MSRIIPWTKEQEELIKNRHLELTTTELAQLVGHTLDSTRAKMNRLGIHRRKTNIGEINYEILNPYWVSGFTDGEGCFCVAIPINKHKASISPFFKINLREDDQQILDKINLFFGDKGQVYKIDREKEIPSHNNQAIFTISGFKSCYYLIKPFFEKYKLQAKKLQSFLKWCEILEYMKSPTGVMRKLLPKEILQIDLMRKDMNQTKTRFKVVYDEKTKRFSRIKL